MKVGEMLLILPTAVLNVSRFRCVLAEDRLREFFSLGVSDMTREWPRFRFKGKTRFSFCSLRAQLLLYQCLHLLLDQLSLKSPEILWHEK